MGFRAVGSVVQVGLGVLGFRVLTQYDPVMCRRLVQGLFFV